MHKVEEVFGVNKDPVLSYVERTDVDGMFVNALNTDKQIIVYGASKQGKTSLVEKHLPYRNNITVSLTPKFELIDIYKSVLGSLGVKLETQTTTTSSSELEIGIGAKVKAFIPCFSSEIEAKSTESKASSASVTHNEIELNLALPNDVARAFNECGNNKFIILENFHYLEEEAQKQFAFDLRSFQELGIRFVILGVWREKNRLIQFNGDLLDRIFEIPVEPWEAPDFQQVVEKGSGLLNIKFSDEMVEEIVQNSFDSIGVVQELLKSVCQMSGVHQTQPTNKEISDITGFKLRPYIYI